MKTMNIEARAMAGLVILCFTVFSIGSTSAVTDEDAEPMLGGPAKQEQPEYAPGQLIVKLKEGKALDDIADLNTKYNVISTEKVFKDISNPENTLKQLKDKLAKLSPGHKGWYWQLDKDSNEYKEYMEKIEKEKEELNKQIQSQEGLIARLKARQKRAPDGAEAPKLDNIYLLKMEGGVNAPAIAQDYSKNPNVEYAEPNYKARAQMIPNDKYYSSAGSWGQSYDDLWGLKKIQCEQAWDISQGEGVVVAVIDTGIDYNHEDIRANVWSGSNGKRGYDFWNNDDDPMDDNGHGTHVAGIIAAVGNNIVGIVGAAPKAKVMAVKGLDKYGSGFTDGLADAIYFAAGNAADILNNSWGGQGRSRLITDAVNYACSQGCIVIAAAGNKDSDAVKFFPANIAGVITVAASYYNDKKCSFSNWGFEIDVVAPGNNILSTMPDESWLVTKVSQLKIAPGYYRLTGTSMACPYVSGLAALVVARYPDYTNLQAAGRIASTTDEIDSINPGLKGLVGTGRINAYNALVSQPHPILRVISVKPSSYLKADKTVQIAASLKNKGFTALNVNISLTTSSPYVTINSGSCRLGVLEWSELGDNKDNPFSIYIHPGLPPETESIPFVLRITADGGYQFDYEFTLSPLNPHLKWVTVIQGINSVDAPIVEDLNNDGKNEIVVELTGVMKYDRGRGQIAVLNADGAFMPGWPINPDPKKGHIFTGIAVGDIDGDGFKDVVAAGERMVNPASADPYAPNGVDGLEIYAYNYLGQALPNFPIYRPARSDQRVGHGKMSLGNIDSDNYLDIVLINPFYAFAYNHLGQLLSGWPVDLHSSVYSGGEPNSQPAIGRVDGDSAAKIAFLSASDWHKRRIHLLKGNGAYFSPVRWPIDVDYAQRDGPVTMADLDKDGRLEILTISGRGDKTGLYVYRDSNEQMLFVNEPHSNNYSGQEAVPVDLDGDGDLEIIIPSRGLISGAVDAWHHNGAPVSGWPVTYPGQISSVGGGARVVVGDDGTSVVAGDIDGDGKQEILLVSYSLDFYESYVPIEQRDTVFINAWHHDGGIVKGFPIKLSVKDVGLWGSNLVITDLDNDGAVDLVMARFGDWIDPWTPTTYISRIELPGQYNKDNIQWPMFHHDPQRTGYCSRPDMIPPATAISGIDGFWHNSSVTATLTAADNPGGSGVDKIYYSLNGAAFSECANGGSITILNEGRSTLEYYSKDKTGNEESPRKIAEIKIDKRPPAIIATVTPAPNVNGWNNTPVTVTYMVSDTAGSGVDVSKASGYTDDKFNSAGQFIAEGKAFDLAGNTSSIRRSIKIDKTAPATSNVSITQQKLTNKRSRNTYICRLTIQAMVTDNEGSGLDTVNLSLGGMQVFMSRKANNIYAAQVDFPLTSAGKAYSYSVTAKDKAANQSVKSGSYMVTLVSK